MLEVCTAGVHGSNSFFGAVKTCVCVGILWAVRQVSSSLAPCKHASARNLAILRKQLLTQTSSAAGALHCMSFGNKPDEGAVLDEV